MNTEIILATLFNLKWAFSFIAFNSGAGVVVFGIIYAFNRDTYNEFCLNKSKECWDSIDQSAAYWMGAGKKGFKYSCLIILISFPLSMVPNIDDIWKVRLGLIKLQLASPENIQKGTDEIGRIAKKLECKYIGCEESKQKE